MIQSRLNDLRITALFGLVVLLSLGLTIGTALADPGANLLDMGEAITVELRVPQDYPTIQEAIDAAQNGYLILVSPGTYSQALQVTGKTVTLASEFYTTGDETFVDATIIDGGINIDANSAGTRIIGFTIQNGPDGIQPRSPIEVLNNRIRWNIDGIDFEGGIGSVVEYNIFEENTDDGIDLDRATAVTIRHNTIRNNNSDGIEMRIHHYDGTSPLEITISNNSIVGNGDDGLQIIEDLAPGETTNRLYVIDRNLIANNGAAGLGFLDHGVTNQDFRASKAPDPVYFVNNTVVGNDHGVSGSGSPLVVVNNLIAGHINLGLKKVDADSHAAHNLFWNNGIDYQDSNVDLTNSVFADPLLDGDFTLLPGSPAIDAGTAYFEWQGEVIVDIPAGAYSGEAPDLGWRESGSGAPTETPTPGPTSTPTPVPGDRPVVTAVSSGTTSGASLAFPHTALGLNRFLLVGISINNDEFETVDSVTFGGAQLTFVDEITQSDDARVEIWQTVAPLVGSHDVVINFSADLVQYAVAGAISFTGVDQTNPLRPFAGNEATSNHASVTVESAANDLVLAVFSCETCQSAGVSPPGVERWNVVAGSGREIGVGATQDGSSPQVTVEASLGTSDHWAMAAVSIRPIPADGPTATPTPTLTPTSTPATIPTSTSTPTVTPAPTQTPTDTSTPTPTSTSTPPATPAPTQTPTNTSTPMPTSTATTAPTDTATPTITPANTSTPTPTSTATQAPTNTPTPVPPTATPAETPVAETIYVSSSSDGSVGGLSFADEDILAYNISTSAWSMYFDGSDVGLSGSGANDVDAFAFHSDGSILLSVWGATTLPDIGSVDDSDIVRFIPTSLGNATTGTFEWYFDGSDVDLTAGGEDVDAVHVLSNGDLLISTSGSFAVSGASGEDEDLIRFSPTSLGINTAGTWSVYFDGSDLGLNSSSDEDIWGVWVNESAGDLNLTTRGQFSVSGASGDGADIFVCDPGPPGNGTSCTFSLFWDGSAFGYGGERMDAIALSTGGQP